MLVIGHRGAAGLAPENTLQSLQAGVDAGADMLEFDVRLTADDVPILSHDATLHRRNIRRNSLSKLQDAGHVTTLASALDAYYGRIRLNLEHKSDYGANVVHNLLRREYIEQPEDWDNVLISSFSAHSLSLYRARSRDCQLALLHGARSNTFRRLHDELNLSAVGWNKSNIDDSAIQAAKKLGLFTYAYTVNELSEAEALVKRGIEGICTDFPNRLSGRA